MNSLTASASEEQMLLEHTHTPLGPESGVTSRCYGCAHQDEVHMEPQSMSGNAHYTKVAYACNTVI